MDPTYQAALAVLPQPWADYVATGLATWFAVCTLASAADASFPPPAEGSRWVPLRNAIHFLAINKGYARNAVPAGAIPAGVAAHATEVREAAAAIEGAAGTLAQAAQGKPEALPSPDSRP